MRKVDIETNYLQREHGVMFVILSGEVSKALEREIV